MTLPDLHGELQRLDAQRLLRRRRTLQGGHGAQARVGGRDYLAFAANDYLGLAGDPRLVDAAREGAERYGVGAGASHLVHGHGEAHAAFEAAAAEFVGLPGALLFSSGYMANIGVVTALAGRRDAVFADRLNHASLNDAALLSRAQFKRYPHANLGALERLLAGTPARRKLVATDAVFSMDGDIAPLPQLLALCERYDAWLYVDDAHGFGVLGENGRGALSHFALASPRIVYMATLGKSAGVAGAFVAGSAELVEWLVNRAHTYVYTTALPPLLAHALCASLAIVRTEDWRRKRLSQLTGALREGLRSRRWRLLESASAIQPLIVGDNAGALALSAALEARGILVPAIRPPTVPPGSARLRISLSAAHQLADVERLLAALAEIERAG